MRERDVSRLPTVAIVGRANVGKSTLFNRLLRTRRALVEDRPGVTRDCVAAHVTLENRDVLLVDTGGLDPEADEGIPAAILAQVDLTVEDAAVVLFVVNVRHGLLPLDAQIARRLRRACARVVLVANKADGPRSEAGVTEFHSLGFPEIIPTSAEHNRGIADLEIAIAERLGDPTPEDPAREEGIPRLALIGRPNAGKSTLFNSLLGRSRAIISDEPGTTRDAHESRLPVGDRELILVDTAGLRRPGRRRESLERGSAFMALRAIERADLVLLVVDAEVGVSDQDARIARLALDCGRALLIALNKWDCLEERSEREQIERQLDRKLGFVRHSTVLRISARTGQGVKRIPTAVLDRFDELQRDVPTAEVNRVLRELVERNPPPFQGRRRARFYYATQTSRRPFTLLLFLNDPELVPRNYRRYLESNFQKTFGLRSAPVRLHLRSRVDPALDPR